MFVYCDREFLKGLGFSRDNVFITDDLEALSKKLMNHTYVSLRSDSVHCYTLLYVMDSNEEHVLTMRHTDDEVYSIRSICTESVWEGQKGIRRTVLDNFESNYTGVAPGSFSLVGAYYTTMTPEDAEKLRIVYKTTVDEINKIRVKAPTSFYDLQVISKVEAFNFRTEYNHYSSWVVFKLFHPDL